MKKEEEQITEICRGTELWEVLNLTKGQFNQKFKSMAAGWRGKGILQRNAYFALNRQNDSRLVDWEVKREKENSLPPMIQPYVKIRKTFHSLLDN
jgi:epoxyqueuosine reductase